MFGAGWNDPAANRIALGFTVVIPEYRLSTADRPITRGSVVLLPHAAQGVELAVAGVGGLNGTSGPGLSPLRQSVS